MRVLVCEPRTEPTWLTNMVLPRPIVPDARKGLRAWSERNQAFLDGFVDAVAEHVAARGLDTDIDVDHGRLDATLRGYVFDTSDRA
jgi:hypothetical protein